MTGLKSIGVKKYVKQQDGATAIEFGLLAVPFFFLILGTIEMSLFYASGVTLEGAATAASRLIRTGQVQKSGDPQTAFEQTMCDKAGAVLSCDEIVYEVINLGDSFSGANSTPPSYDAEGNMIPSGFEPGDAEDVIMVRLSYRHDFFSPLLGPFLGDDTGTNSALHTSTVVLRTEPYRF
ncbi:MAG: TadE/TadG family type IV pilus assembly protein [Pseudomonadota bacterium]